jgi:type VI secretion system ImpM family protein
VKRAELGAPGVLGKHPSHGDFLKIGNREHEFTSFDAFLTHNIEWAEEKAGPSWEQAFLKGGVFAFAYRPTTGGRADALVGAFGPSVDRAGRRFPLSVGMPLTANAELLASPEIMPLVFEPCWQTASDFVLSLALEPDASVATRLLGVLPPVVELEEALVSYAEWTRSLPIEELWELIFGESRPVDPAAVLALIGDAVRTCRGVERPTTPLSLRLPLGIAGGAAVCFWLDWVRSLARWKATLPSFFWSHDGEQGTMILCLGMPPRCTLAELWMPTGQRDEICDVATAPWDIRLPESAGARWRDLTVAGGRTVAGLLHAAHTFEL